MKGSIILKSILGLLLGVVIGISLSGCSSTDDLQNDDDIQEVENVDDVEVEEDNEEIEEVLNIEDDEFKKAISSNLTDNAYASYFNSKRGSVIEFDGCINLMQLREGYDTRYEMILTYGDFSEEAIFGPYMKIDDIAYNDKLDDSVLGARSNVKVRAKIDKYDTDKSYLILEPIFIEAR